uniref:Uncharacterized protein n=1 Tax=Arundo donax TaxID=35708 RepID=A0A0A8XQN3_ARUDO
MPCRSCWSLEQAPASSSSCQRSSPFGASLRCCVDQWPGLGEL